MISLITLIVRSAIAVTRTPGNLTWWTTDQDITDAIQKVGVQDMIDVKFFENRSNGQSKGFCVVTLGSEASFKTLMELLPKEELHGANPIVTPCTRQSLNQFEVRNHCFLFL